MAADTAAPAGAGHEPSHFRRIFLVWIVIAVALDLFYWFVLGPNVPPGKLGSAAQGQQFDINILTMLCLPVVSGVITYFGYSLIVWRRREGDDEDGIPLYGNARIQVAWITVTSAIVLGLFVFGTYQLIVPFGAGGGQGAAPIWNPPGARLTVAEQKAPWSPGHVLVVQAIGQQWKWTFRYPQFGGFETNHLILPTDTWVQFNVTSLDVIHSFWAYQLGVKADANPGVNNVAYTKTQHEGGIVVRCAELCGLWHGAMFDYGKVVKVSQFNAWVASTRIQYAAVTAILNKCQPYATTYNPTIIPGRCSGPVMRKLGITSAGGGYYPPQDPEQP